METINAKRKQWQELGNREGYPYNLLVFDVWGKEI